MLSSVTPSMPTRVATTRVAVTRWIDVANARTIAFEL